MSKELASTRGLNVIARHATEMGLDLSNCSLEEYEMTAQSLAAIGSAEGFWVGDFILAGKARFESQLPRILTVFGDDHLAQQTMFNKASVCRQFPPERRKYKLSFSHYAEVAPLSHEMQDKALAKAEAGGWTRQQLRSSIQELKNNAAAVASIPPVTPYVEPPRIVDAPPAVSTIEIEREVDVVSDRSDVVRRIYDNIVRTLSRAEITELVGMLT